MNLRRNIKSQARQALQGCWASARIILIVMVALSMLISLLDATIMGLLGYEFTYSSINSFAYSENFFFDPVSMLFSLGVWVVRMLILTPLSVGMINWYRQLTDRRRLGVSHIFWVYEGRAWLRSIWVSITIGLRMVGVGVLLFALPVTMFIGADFLQGSPMLATVVLSGGWLLGIVATVIFVVFAKRYALVSLLLGEQYNMTAKEATRTSVCYTRGHCFELLLVDLSFLPFMLPLITLSAALLVSTTIAYDPFSLMPMLLLWGVLLTAVITALKVQPYYTMTQVMYARYLYEYGCSRKPLQVQESTQDTMRRYGYVQPDEAQPAATTVWQPVNDDAPMPATSATPTTGVVWRHIED